MERRDAPVDGSSPGCVACVRLFDQPDRIWPYTRSDALTALQPTSARDVRSKMTAAINAPRRYLVGRSFPPPHKGTRANRRVSRYGATVVATRWDPRSRLPDSRVGWLTREPFLVGQLIDSLAISGIASTVTCRAACIGRMPSLVMAPV